MGSFLASFLYFSVRFSKRFSNVLSSLANSKQGLSSDTNQLRVKQNILANKYPPSICQLAGQLVQGWLFGYTRRESAWLATAFSRHAKIQLLGMGHAHAYAVHIGTKKFISVQF